MNVLDSNSFQGTHFPYPLMALPSSQHVLDRKHLYGHKKNKMVDIFQDNCKKIQLSAFAWTQSLVPQSTKNEIWATESACKNSKSITRILVWKKQGNQEQRGRAKLRLNSSVCLVVVLIALFLIRSTFWSSYCRNALL